MTSVIALHAMHYVGVVPLKMLEFRYEYIVHQLRVQYQQFRAPIREDPNEWRFAPIFSAKQYYCYLQFGDTICCVATKNNVPINIVQFIDEVSQVDR